MGDVVLRRALVPAGWPWGQPERAQPLAIRSPPAARLAGNSRNTASAELSRNRRGGIAASACQHGPKTPGLSRGVRNSRPRRYCSRAGHFRNSSREARCSRRSPSASNRLRRPKMRDSPAGVPPLQCTRHTADRRWPTLSNRRPSPSPESIQSIAWKLLLIHVTSWFVCHSLRTVERLGNTQPAWNAPQ